MKGGYTILDIKKCEFVLNEDETEYVAFNNYTKSFAQGLYSSNKVVLVENLNSLFSGDYGSGFMSNPSIPLNFEYFNYELPNYSRTSIYIHKDGHITIAN